MSIRRTFIAQLLLVVHRAFSSQPTIRLIKASFDPQWCLGPGFGLGLVDDPHLRPVHGLPIRHATAHNLVVCGLLLRSICGRINLATVTVLQPYRAADELILVVCII